MSRTEQKLSVLWAAVPRIKGEKGSGLQTDKETTLPPLPKSSSVGI